MAALGNPQDTLRCIHIAGTNGKGAVAAMLDSVLRAAGYRVVRYTSPHLVAINERFFIDGEPVADDALAAVADEVLSVIARLERDGVVFRITRGVYCKRIKTPFGDYVPSKDMIYGRWLVLDGDRVIGYETGLSLMNQLGLVSQMPRKKWIATNNYTLPVPKDVEIEVQKPRATVTNENYKYLQILDMIDSMGEAPVDAAAPEEIIREKTESAGLLPDRLILYARKFYPTKTLERTVDVILGGLEL